MEILNKKQKIILIVVVAFILIFIGYYIIKKTNENKYTSLEIIEENETIDNNTEETSNIIIVHITGEVKKQGIIEIEEGARIANIIDKAGGVTEEADLSKINLAYQVEDGQKIYIPNKKDIENIEYITDDAGEKVVDNDANKTEKININTSSQTELETLSGIGPSTALKIIEYREENGKFKTIEDIKNVTGIGDAKFENIKESICVK